MRRLQPETSVYDCLWMFMVPSCHIRCHIIVRCSDALSTILPCISSSPRCVEYYLVQFKDRPHPRMVHSCLKYHRFSDSNAKWSPRKVCLAAADESKPPASLVQLFEPGKEEPLLLGCNRLGTMNACPSKEVFRCLKVSHHFSCYSCLHWISNIVWISPSFFWI